MTRRPVARENNVGDITTGSENLFWQRALRVLFLLGTVCFSDIRSELVGRRYRQRLRLTIRLEWGWTIHRLADPDGHVVILAMLAVIVNIVWNGLERLTWEFVSANPTQGMTAGGIFPAIYGTVLLVLLMSAAAVPFGVIVAIYFAEYARSESRLYRWTRMAVNNLAGVPSIVFGLFGLGFFIQSIGRGLDQSLMGGRVAFGQPSILWAAMTIRARASEQLCGRVVRTDRASIAKPRWR
jgi:ABC-type phosphate transport system permease subunit